MDRKHLLRRRLQQLFTLLMLAITVLTMVEPTNTLVSSWDAVTHPFLFSCLFFALFFFIRTKIRLMFVCIGCASAICFFKIESKEPNPTILPPYLPKDTSLLIGNSTGKPNNQVYAY
jgi:hypothetical protein